VRGNRDVFLLWFSDFAFGDFLFLHAQKKEAKKGRPSGAPSASSGQAMGADFPQIVWIGRTGGSGLLVCVIFRALLRDGIVRKIGGSLLWFF